MSARRPGPWLVGSAMAGVVALALAGCGDGAPASIPTLPATDASDASDASDATDATQTADTSPRGLAAAVLHHLDEATVTYVGGAGGRDALTASIGLSDPDVTTLYIAVNVDRRAAIDACGVDFGFQVVECDTGASLREVVVKRGPTCDGPILMGRYDDDDRGSVLVELFGDDTPANRDLVAELIDDPTVGRTTTTAINAEGAELDFEKSQSTFEIYDDGDGDAAC